MHIHLTAFGILLTTMSIVHQSGEHCRTLYSPAVAHYYSTTYWDIHDTALQAKNANKYRGTIVTVGVRKKTLSQRMLNAVAGDWLRRAFLDKLKYKKAVFSVSGKRIPSANQTRSGFDHTYLSKF